MFRRIIWEFLQILNKQYVSFKVRGHCLCILNIDVLALSGIIFFLFLAVVTWLFVNSKSIFKCVLMFVCSCVHVCRRLLLWRFSYFAHHSFFFCNINIKKMNIYQRSRAVCCGIGRVKSRLSVWMRGEPGELIFDQMCFGFNSAAAFFSAALFA